MKLSIFYFFYREWKSHYIFYIASIGPCGCLRRCINYRGKNAISYKCVKTPLHKVTPAWDLFIPNFKTGGFWIFFVRTLFNTASSAAPRIHRVGGRWDRTQESCDLGIGCQTLQPLGYISSTIRLHLIHTRLHLIHTRLHLIHTWLYVFSEQQEVSTNQPSPETIEWCIEDHQTYLPWYDLGPPPPHPHPSTAASKLSHFISLPVCRLLSLLSGECGRGAKSYDKAWSSRNH